MKIRTITVSIFLLLNYSGVFTQSYPTVKTKGFLNVGEEKIILLGPYGGNVKDLIIDPENNDILYAGFRSVTIAGYRKGIIYRTTDDGENWSPFYEMRETRHFETMEIDPNNSDNLYVGSNKDIYISNDGGNSWTSNPIIDRNINWFGIKVNKFNSNIIYGFGYFYSGIQFLKTTNGGENWTTKVITSLSRLRYNKNFWAFDETDFKKIYISAYSDYTGQYTNYLFRSTDEGETWTNINIDTKITIGDYIRCIDVDKNGIIILCSGGSGIYRSTDSGENWIHLSSQPDDLLSIKYLRDDPDVIVGGGSDTVFVSTDGGSTWQASNLAQNKYGEIDLLVLKSSKDYIIGNSFGVFKSTNEGTSWERKISGLNPQQSINTLENAHDITNSIYAGLHNGLYKSENDGKNWNILLPQSNIRSLAVDKEFYETIYATEFDYYTGVGILNKTTDNGETWQQIAPVTDPEMNIFSKNNCVWMTFYDAALDYYKLKKSTDGGVNWTESVIAPFELKGTSFIKDPYNDSLLYVSGYSDILGYRKGLIYRSINGGDYWHPLYDAAWGNEINSICVDPSNTDNIYFTGVSGLFKSSDDGITWKNLNSSDLDAIYVDNNGVVYAAGVYKLIVSSDGGDTWDTYGYHDGMVGKTRRNCIAFDETNKILYVGTQDWGILSMNFGETTKIEDVDKKLINSCRLLSNYPNPFNQQTAIRYQVLGNRDQGIGATYVRLEIYNILGQLVTTLVEEEKQPGEYTVIWNGKDMHWRDVPSGVYFYRMKVGEFMDVKKMILMK